MNRLENLMTENGFDYFPSVTEYLSFRCLSCIDVSGNANGNGNGNGKNHSILSSMKLPSGCLEEGCGGSGADPRPKTDFCAFQASNNASR